MNPTGRVPALETTIEPSPRAPGEARRAVERLGDALDEGTLRDVQLIISELVTNSVRHSGSDDHIHLRAWSGPEGVKLEVADGGLGFEPGEAEPTHEGGRGLLILDALASRWGVSRDAQTRVWFEVEPQPLSGP